MTPGLPPESSSSFKTLQPLACHATSDSEAKGESVIHHSTFSSSLTKAQTKRSHAERSTATPPGSPKKKKWKNQETKETKEKVMDTTARALKAIADGSEKKGLLRYFHKETEEERERCMRREDVESDLGRQKAAEEAILKARQDTAAKEIERFEAKMRKRKSRSKTYERERAAGVRDKNLRLKRQRVS
jgi:hypothetical protein